ncbi:PaaX family transcriptional regulator [Limimaricola cinnabarinus]|uniref:Phenylacetic acid degradation operon negative regulatory protein PaaX n=1 Tax=Limimaricola cinnabarinus LL-001 TaxID=1337093 RepID=U3A9S1_9RHOB|nr:PaaX family transcriptional regulator C-terminal domain-containing protein [Limimaricola cinnabarinus]GAD54399.1 phenylacetic acid degradation operon negative regulatory protein PaaX [Limimaricola cinnabarinus LL-001]
MSPDLLDRALAANPVSAGAFIVTLYGDVVAPRGGEIWMGNIITACAAVGLNESRVRTAVSRLVAAKRIEGVKDGRRSFYRLTPAAEDEFQRAARLIYRRPRVEPLRGWHLVTLPQGPGREALVTRLTRLRFGMAEPYLAILPDRGDGLPPLGAPHFRATTGDDLSEMARTAWPLDALAERMRHFMEGFAPLEGLACSPEEALGLRLLLVHVYRDIALSDPALPLGLLPDDWQGPEVRALFARLYLHLTSGADAAVARDFIDRDGPLRADPTRIARRIADLSYD